MGLKYDLDFLRDTGHSAKLEENYHMFSLGYGLRMKIIDLDRRKKARLYRRSRAGKRLHHKIQTLSTKLRLHRPRNRSLVQGNNVIIPSTVNRVCKKTIDYRCATVNCCLIVNKTSDFKVELMEHKLDVCALTEIWIREGDDTTAIQLCLDGYSSVSIPREGRIGGSIAIVHRSDITLRSKSVYNYQTMECADFLLHFQNMLVNLCVIYWPPDTSIASFCDDLMDYQERNVTSLGKMIIVGDVNIHTNKEQHPDSALFQEALDGLGLRDHVNFATHHLSNSLDAVITSQDDPLVNTVVQGELFSDHHWIFFNITNSIIIHRVEEMAYRKIKLISPDAFVSDISCELELADVDHLNLRSGLALYNSTLTKVLNQHAPMKRKSAPIHKQVPWFTESIRNEVRKHRQLEQIWRQDKVNSDKYQDFCTQHRLVSNLLFLTEREYYHDIFHEHRTNTKQMFKVM